MLKNIDGGPPDGDPKVSTINIKKHWRQASWWVMTEIQERPLSMLKKRRWWTLWLVLPEIQNHSPSTLKNIDSGTCSLRSSSIVAPQTPGTMGHPSSTVRGTIVSFCFEPNTTPAGRWWCPCAFLSYNTRLDGLIFTIYVSVQTRSRASHFACVASVLFFWWPGLVTSIINLNGLSYVLLVVNSYLPVSTLYNVTAAAPLREL
jgi:hypothetical protein